MKRAMTNPIHVRLRHRREALGMSQRELAAQIGTTQSAISELENGLGEPRLSTVQRWADALGFDVRDLRLVDRGTVPRRGGAS